MKAVGRFQIQSPVVGGAVETFTAKDPSADTTVLLHLLPAGETQDPEKTFLEFAPGCPGKILDTGVDDDSQRAYVVTEYPKDRKSLLLWIKSLSSLPPKPAAAKPAPPPPKPASDGATRMFDPAAMFGGTPSTESSASAAAAPSDSATRMFDPSAIFGGSPQPAAAPDAGATKMFDPSAVFGGQPSSPSPATPASPAPEPARKTPPPRSNRPLTDPFANLKSALERAAGNTAAPPSASKPEGGEFTRRFELPKEFRNAPTRVDRTQAPPPSPEHHKGPEGDKGIFTLMMEAYGQRVDQADEVNPPAPSASETPNSDGSTRMFDPSALFAGAPSDQARDSKNVESGETADDTSYPPTVRMPAMPDDEDKTSH